MPESDTIIVHDLFIERWADRYYEITYNKGEANAVAWINTFINPRDRARLKKAITSRAGTRK